MIKAVIFDMDGLMVDSEPLQSLAFEELVKSYGKTPIPHEHGLMQMVGLGGDDNYIMVREKHNIEDNISVLREKRLPIYFKILGEKVTPMPGLLELLKLLKKEEFKTAVASSSHMYQINLVLEKLNIASYFDKLVSGTEMPHHKPSPDIYLEAAKQLDLEPRECVALEDSSVGVQSGNSAGMKVIAVPSTYTITQDLSKADKIVNSLTEVTLDLIHSL